MSNQRGNLLRHGSCAATVTRYLWSPPRLCAAPSSPTPHAYTKEQAVNQTLVPLLKDQRFIQSLEKEGQELLRGESAMTA